MQSKSESKGKQTLNQKTVKQHEESHYITIKVSVQQKKMTVVNIYVLNAGIIYINKKLDLKGR